MTFVKTTWNDDALPDLTAAQLNRMEQGIADAHAGTSAGTLQKIGDLALAAGGLSGAGAGQLGINNIPQTFAHLRLLVRAQSQAAGDDNVGIRLNGSLANYVWQYKGMNNAGPFDGTVASGQAYGYIGSAPGASRANDNYISHQVIDIPFYTLADSIKTWHSMSSYASSAAAFQGVTAQGSNVGFAGAITALTLLASGGALGPRTKATLYGIV